MPAWKGILSDGDIRDVVSYTKSLSPRFSGETPRIVTLGPAVDSSPEGVVRGQRVYEKLQCAACHGIDGRGAKAIATEFWDDWKQPLHASDLTEPWTFHGGATPRDVYLRFRTGLAGTPMPSFVDVASDAEMWDLANYVVSLGRKPIWSMSGPDVAALLARQDAEAKANPVKRGASLVDTLACAVCHSPYDEQQRMLPGLRLAGGMLCASSHSAIFRRVISPRTRRPASGTGQMKRSSERSRAASSRTERVCCRIQWTGHRSPT